METKDNKKQQSESSLLDEVNHADSNKDNTSTFKSNLEPSKKMKLADLKEKQIEEHEKNSPSSSTNDSKHKKESNKDEKKQKSSSKVADNSSFFMTRKLPKHISEEAFEKIQFDYFDLLKRSDSALNMVQQLFGFENESSLAKQLAIHHLASTEIRLTSEVSVYQRLALQPGEVNQDMVHFSVQELFKSNYNEERWFLPGAYIIIAGPRAGKTVLAQFIHSQLQKLNKRIAPYLNCLEPHVQTESEETVLSAFTWEEISLALTSYLSNEKFDIFVIDSLRFLNAASRYPAKAKGINSGLEIYATQLNQMCVHANKIGFFVLSTSDSDYQITEIYQNLLIGSAQGLIIPKRLKASQIGTQKGEGQISLRGGSREFVDFFFDTDQPIEGLKRDIDISDVTGNISGVESAISDSIRDTLEQYN